MIYLYILLGIAAGFATPTQTSFNGKLREKMDSPFLSAVISFVVGVAVLLPICAFTEGGIHIPLSAIAENPPWIWAGGLCGIVIVLFNVICLPRLGSARTIILVCFGQIMTSLILDQFGMFGTRVIPMTAVRAIGAALVIAGVVLVSWERNGSQGKDGSGGKGIALFVVMAMITGIACATQVAVNGTLATVAGSSATASLISMCVGSACIVVIVSAMALIGGRDLIFDHKPPARGKIKPWMVIGGAFGAFIVLANAAIAPVLGTGLSTVMNLVGMMSAGLIIDARGFLGIEKKPVTPVKVTGMVIMILGTYIITLW